MAKTKISKIKLADPETKGNPLVHVIVASTVTGAIVLLWGKLSEWMHDLTLLKLSVFIQT